MVEAQAVDRVHRIGQLRDVVITRYLIRDSIEFVSSHNDVTEYGDLIDCRRLVELTKGPQYVRGVQQHKLRLIHQSLSSTEHSQGQVDRERFKVRESEPIYRLL